VVESHIRARIAKDDACDRAASIFESRVSRRTWSFSEEAAVKLLGEDIQLVPRQTFEALYASIQDALRTLSLAPIENSLPLVHVPTTC